MKYPDDETIDRILKLTKKYSELSVNVQQRFNMFDYIRQHWKDNQTILNLNETVIAGESE
jgi:hypothetical protein